MKTRQIDEHGAQEGHGDTYRTDHDVLPRCFEGTACVAVSNQERSSDGGCFDGNPENPEIPCNKDLDRARRPPRAWSGIVTQALVGSDPHDLLVGPILATTEVLAKAGVAPRHRPLRGEKRLHRGGGVLGVNTTWNGTKSVSVAERSLSASRSVPTGLGASRSLSTDSSARLWACIDHHVPWGGMSTTGTVLRRLRSVPELEYGTFGPGQPEARSVASLPGW